ncbi:hypothetical protein AWM75_00980 [Aerococcus urinaehominis]|uniref:DUF4767 domain-containing protein n=1 Tax=Aerococcus urinaehominis TaxID=128944 RepID=A0A0X8FJV4_9LACT|nr:DUF4767 domain-containing protein [Aerococcus urinaehominis]AMB98653.1 hypothetical protein AWM75_00980 [Aerococcus urinaehominis]
MIVAVSLLSLAGCQNHNNSLAQNSQVESMPAEYLEILEEYQTLLPDIKNNNQKALEQARYVEALDINNTDTKAGIQYAQHDLDGNGIGELFLASRGDQARVFHIYTLNTGQLTDLAGYNVEGAHIGNRGGLDFYEDGRIVASLSGGATTSNYSDLELPAGAGNFEVIRSYHRSAMPDALTIRDQLTGQEITDEEFNQYYSSESLGEPMDIFSQWEWQGIEENQAIAPKPDHDRGADEASSNSDQIDKQAYLNLLRNRWQVWANKVQPLIDQDAFTADQIGIRPLPSGDLHPIVPALHQAASQSLAEDDQSEIPRHLMVILSHSFVLEKMLLPELDKNSQDSLDNLRYDIVQSRQAVLGQLLAETPIVSFEWEAKWLAGYDQQLAQLLARSDREFDDLNLISIHSGVAVEAFPMLSSDVGSQFGFTYDPSRQRFYTINDRIGAQDVSGTKVYFYDFVDGGITRFTPGSGNRTGESIDQVDLSQLYGVKLDNHYPQRAMAGQAKNQASSNDQDALANFMTHWGQEMGQTYKAYQLDQPVDFYGTRFPEKEFQVVLDGQNIQFKDGQSTDANYKIDAIYSDIADQDNPSQERHLYLFTQGVNGPQVWVTMQGADDQGRLHFKQTANQALKAGYLKHASN